ncbi:MAG: PD40 domain-containing protein, partial [Hyphomonas sp.]|nr:PD40 domain-containing protein [Hyphomonas sp.]
VAGGDAVALTTGMALDTQPVASPDGASILFLSDRSGAENLWLMDADGAHPRQLTFHDDNPDFVSPEWAPDGQSIFVSRFWADRNGYELWQVQAEPGAAGRVVRAADPEAEQTVSSLDAVVSQDGGALYLASLAEGDPSFDEVSPWQIVRLDLATGEEVQVLPADTTAGGTVPRFRPVLSPDGTSMAFLERRAGITRLMLLDFATGGIRHLLDLDPDSLEAALTHDAAPRFDFSADGQSIYVTVGGKIGAISLTSGAVTAVPFTATVDQQLGKLVRFQAPVEQGPVRARLIQSPALSPDGRRVAFSALGHAYTQALEPDAKPVRIGGDSDRLYHPSWSPDGSALATVSWTRAEGGQVWLTDAAAGAARQVTTDAAFYTHPVFTPAGDALVVVRSATKLRHETYMEYGQLREADLVLLPLDGGQARILASGRIGGTPHFRGRPGEVMINFADGVHAISFEGGNELVTQALGPNWYFAHGSAAADDVRVSPDGQWALAQIAQQLHLYRIDPALGAEVDVSDPQVPHVQLTDIGADYFGWGDDGASLFWSVGSTVYRMALADISFEGRRGGQAATRYDVTVLADRDTPSGAILLTGATLLPMTQRGAPGAVLPDADVLVEGNRIAAIGPAGTLAVPPGAERVDVTGKFIMPGLIDAHYHVADIRRDVLQFDAWGLKTGLAYGVTTLFDPSSLTIDMLAYEDLVETGDVLGSRLYTTGPAVFDYNDFRTRDDVLAVLSRYTEHYRLSNLKQYRAGNRRVRQWIIEAADELGLTVTTEGALSYKLDLTQILDGYSGVEHAMPPPVHHDDLTQLFARSGTSSTLTLMITHGGAPADKVFIERTKPFEDEKYARFVPERFRKSRFLDVEAGPAEAYLYPQVAASAADLFRAGGTVGLGAHGDIPGFGTHWELQAYVEGGWTPAEALWAATMGSATAIGRDASLGSLAPGKLADLVVLDASPLDDIRNTLAVSQVMKNGRLYDGETLEEHSAGGQAPSVAP